MNTDKLIELLSKEDLELPEYYPLNLAICWVAYGDKPLPVDYANILYDVDNIENRDPEKFEQASKSLRFFLKKGDIESAYYGYTDFYQRECHHESASGNIQREDWSGEVDWQNSILCYYDMDAARNDKYLNIRVNTENLLRQFPIPKPQNKTKENLSPKERTSLLKILYGLAVAKYKFDTHPRDTTSKIHTDLLTNNINIDKSTIKKWLDASKAEFEDK